MPVSVRKAADRIEARARRGEARRDERRRQIAEAALQALMAYGCAGTTLRDIAEQSQLSLGMLHYYFEDRRDLVIYCLGLYRDSFMARFEPLAEAVGTREELVSTLAAGLTDAVLSDTLVNRFWYDIRSQSLFDPAILPVVAEFEAALIDLGRRLADRIGFPPDEIELRFAMLEGVFRYHAHRQIVGKGTARDEVHLAFVRVLTVRIEPAGGPDASGHGVGQGTPAAGREGS